MAVTYTTAVKTNRITATRDYFANGDLRIGTAGMGTILATFGLSASGGTISTDTWTLVFDASTVTAGGTGAAAEAEIRTSGGVVGVSGLTVGTSGTDIVLDSTSVTSGQDVTLSSATIQHA